MDKGHLFGAFVSNLPGPSRSGNTPIESDLLSFAGAFSSTHTLPQHSITEKLQDIPNCNPELPCRKQVISPPMYAGAGLRARRHTDLKVSGASTSRSSHTDNDVIDLSMPILSHSDSRDTALGSFENPISVDDDWEDNDVAIAQ